MGEIRGLVRDPMPSWRNHLSRLKGQTACHGDVSDELIRLGYETNKDWLQLLDDVSPDMTESRTPERQSLRRRFDHGWRDLMGALAYAGQRFIGWP